jgi:ribosomal protein S18 acetylase RimI-like enzyme
MEHLVRHAPGALIVAEEDGRIAGTVIAAWDGWRGSVYRLVVAAAHRRKGVGAGLLAAAETRLAEDSAQRLQAIVVESDPRALGFWQAARGWERQVNRYGSRRDRPPPVAEAALQAVQTGVVL